ncbi:2Fe-2S iron-sulfur cluster binding domain-containing protein [Pseudomaricurvus alkylphenolicus]|uniref:2Fe-2S iron-sulfur cluster-binding protein n=1 Tax=Pseudomaricurvus alkylphenolicus TaxID=1306991 RepID=UPI00141FD071|nr:2Fe-2S iron-sulfur cluster-binding protein [Pseudomaricurvus alkylphenolicus]NIB44073.1 2Fe-2S iron-sulfur cluster binding domain-containing protein [Pseudomaricurvus alkylphenolicus]
MIDITVIEHDGTVHIVKTEHDQSLMQAITGAAIPGISADCGGAGACATCHTYVEDAWKNRFPPPEDIEKDLLECAAEVNTNSRLSCQLELNQNLNGLVVRLPENQL